MATAKKSDANKFATLSPAERRLENFDCSVAEKPGKVVLTLDRGDGASFACEVESFLLDEIGTKLRITAIRSAPIGSPADEDAPVIPSSEG